MIKFNPLLIGCASAAILIASCTSGRMSDGQSVQGRSEFELMKYRDPATGSMPVNIRALELDFARTLPGAIGGKDGLESVQDLGSWQQRGPWNIGGRTRAVAMDVSDSKVVLAGAVSGGMWRSIDEGTSWAKMTKSDQLHTVTTVTQDTRVGHQNEWYYGTGEIYGNSSRISGNGIWKSVDGGVSWSVLPSTLSANTPSTNQFAYSWRIIATSNRDTGVVYVATAQSGVVRSTNGGATWMGALGSNALFGDITVTPNGTLYAAFSGFTGQQGSVSSRWGVYRSTDGVQWTNITPPEMKGSVKRIVLAPVPQHPDQIYVLAETPGVGAMGTSNNRGRVIEEWHSLWKYTHSGSNGSDSGKQWEDRSANIPLSEESRGDFYSQGGYDLHIRVSPFDSNLVVVGGTNLYRSTDGFTTTNTNMWIGGYGKTSSYWDRYTLYQNHHPDQHDALFHPTKPNVMFSVNDGGIMRTDDVRASTVAWTELNNGYLTTQFYTVDQEPYAGSSKVLGGMQDNATWTTASASVETPWTRLGGGDGAYCYFADSGRTQYYSSQLGRMFKIFFDENGTELDRARIDPAVDGYLNYLFINPFALHPKDQHIMYLAGGPMVWRNNDVRGIPPGKNDSTSINWDSLSATNINSTRYQISSVCPTTSRDGLHHVVYYGTSDGRIFRLDSAEFGQPKPVNITSPEMRAGSYVNSISVDPLMNERIVACNSNYGVLSIWESTDAGASWKAISGNLEEELNGAGNGPAVNWVGFAPFDANITVLVAATSTGLYFTPTTNGMSTVWTQTATSEIGNVPCDMVVGRVSDGQLAVATHGRGVFTGKITSLPSLPGTPSLISPPDMTRGIFTDTVISWMPVSSAVRYTVRLWKNEKPSEVQTTEGISSTSLRIPSLDQGPVVYSWNVEAFGGGGGGGVSSTWSFSTAVRPPKLLSPAFGATGVIQAMLEWERVPGARTYGLELAVSPSFTPIITKLDGIADTAILVRGLENNKRYFWRVRSADADAVGLFSNRQSFTTGLLSSVDENTEGSAAIRIEPNPAISTVRICIPNNGIYSSRLEVVDAQGKVMITSAVDECTQLDVAGLASGTYTVKVIAGATNLSSSLVIKR